MSVGIVLCKSGLVKRYVFVLVDQNPLGQSRERRQISCGLPM